MIDLQVASRASKLFGAILEHGLPQKTEIRVKGDGRGAPELRVLISRSGVARGKDLYICGLLGDPDELFIREIFPDEVHG